MNRDDISDRLAEITCPALVDGAHAASLTNPEPVNAAILDFLAGLPA